MLKNLRYAGGCPKKVLNIYNFYRKNWAKIGSKIDVIRRYILKNPLKIEIFDLDKKSTKKYHIFMPFSSAFICKGL